MKRDIYNQLIKEYFDYRDRETRQILLSLNESDQDKYMMALAGKLYNAIIEKVDDIDYGRIPLSKGDITKIPNYVEMTECLDTIKNLLKEYKQPSDPVDTVLLAIENLKDSKAIWEKGYTTECNVVIVFYNTIALSIVSAVSFLIAGSIEFIKDPIQSSFVVSLDKVGYVRTKDALIFKDLEKFNKAYKRGEIKKSMTDLLSANRAVKESTVIEEEVLAGIIGGIVVTASVISILMCILPLLHELVAILYSARQHCADYFEAQSVLLALNAENVKLDTTKSADERNKIYKKQIKISDRFKKIANKLAIKLKSSEKESEKIIKNDRKEKYKASDVIKDAPSSASGIF